MKIGSVAPKSSAINRNMRCIEIPIFFGLHQHLPRLIETWDVLKCAFFCAIRSSSKGLIETWDVLKFRCRANPPRESRSCRGGQKAEINRNMGCIEISQSFLLARSTCWINRNMRCIEIKVSFLTPVARSRLIEI